jgi:hypothetical protein
MVATRCGNQHLARLLRDQLDHTLWGFIWRDRPLDFFTPRRQMAAVRGTGGGHRDRQGR